MRNISILTFFSCSLFFREANRRLERIFQHVSISARSRDICIMIESGPFATVFVNWQKNIGTSATRGSSSSSSSSSLSRTCGIGTRNVISREIGHPVRRLTSTWLSVLFSRFSFFPPFRASARADVPPAL